MTEPQLREILMRRRQFEHLFDTNPDGTPRGVEIREGGQVLIDIDQLPVERYHHRVVARLNRLVATG